ncbi:MAG TPA: hypothetical protein VGL20_21880 [Candidatus Dormibacteraeota bacterium]
MTNWGFTSWRRAALPLAVVSLVSAIGFGLGGSHAAGSAAGVGDPEVSAQGVTFVLAPSGDDNFQPGNACAATSLGQNRCTAAIFATDKQPADISYSSDPCPAQTNDQLGLQGISLKSASQLSPCTAAAYLPSSGGQLAIKDFPGASCFPGPCLLFMVIHQHDGDFNAPGLCSAAFYLTSPCTVAVVDTEGHGSTDVIDFSGSSCPENSNLSLPPIGDISGSCTNLPFKPADMTLHLPDNGTPAPPSNPVHSPEVANQALTMVITPNGQWTFDPPNACSIVGLKPVNRCTAAILDVPEGGGDISYSNTKCTLDLSGPQDACVAAPFTVSPGKTAIHNYPAGTLCLAPLPETQPNSTEVGCRIYVMLTRQDGDLNPGGLCSSFTNLSSPCALGVVDTSGRHEGDTVGLSTDMCPTSGIDINGDCTSPAYLPIPDIQVTLPEDPTLGN